MGNKPSRVKVRHECHRFLVTNRTPHRGQMLMPGTASSISAGPSSVPLPEIHDLARRKASLHRPQPLWKASEMTEPQRVRRVVSTVLPTAHGTFQLHGYAVEPDREHVALVLGDLDHAGSNGHVPLVRVHSECLTGDAFGSWRCDCGEQLDAAMREIGREGLGVVIYLRGHEGRGIGLHAKLHAYALQDAGLDTVDANLRLGLPVDARDYDVAAAILRDLGVRRIRLLSANPHKSARLSDLGIEVTARLPLPVTEHPENAFYLATKRRRMGHDSGHSLPDVWSELLQGRVPDRAVAAREAVLLDRYGPLVSGRTSDHHRTAGAERRWLHRIENRRRQLRLWRRGPRAPAPAAGASGCRGRRRPDRHGRRSAADHTRRAGTISGRA